MFQLDRTSATPLADQIELRLRELVESGRLPAGARLSSIRQFAAAGDPRPRICTRCW
jgi:DNA-binding transcriptional regulator YhcF (GntR family)